MDFILIYKLILHGIIFLFKKLPSVVGHKTFTTLSTFSMVLFALNCQIFLGGKIQKFLIA